MKITVNTKTLVDALSSVQGAISNKPTLAILNNVKLDAEGESLKITATDLNLWNFTSCDAVVKESGSSTVSARKFLSILKMTNTETVDLINDGENVIIKSGKSKTVIYGLNPVDYPSLEHVEFSGEFKVNSNVFREMLGHVSYAVSTDQTRQSLWGIYTLCEDNKLTMVATDGRRLAMIESNKVNVINGDSVNAIVPTKIMAEIAKCEGDLLISIGETHIKCVSSSGELYASLIEGVYPNYKQVIPKDFKGFVSLNESQLSNCIARASLLLGDSQSLTLDIKKDSVNVLANSIAESFSDFLECTADEEIVLSFNPSYLLQGIKGMTSDNVTISFNDAKSPMKVSGDEGFVYIIMPMRN